MSEQAKAHVHKGQPLLTSGRALGDAQVAMVLMHGRGSSAEQILTLADWFARPAFAYVAPQAMGNTWYPYSFLVPMERNEPHLSSALQTLKETVAHIVAHGIPTERIVLGGFSQGACLVAEFAARHPQRYGGLFIFSGGVIGPEGTPRDYTGSLDGTPAFVGCSDQDAHIPLARVHETTQVLKGLGAEVTERIYPQMAHTINDDEVEHVQRMMDALIQMVAPGK